MNSVEYVSLSCTKFQRHLSLPFTFASVLYAFAPEFSLKSNCLARHRYLRHDVLMRLLYLLLLNLLPFAVAEDKPAPLPALNQPQYRGELPTDIIKECSGLARSRRHTAQPVFWTHNDSGEGAELFAIDGEGALLRRVKIPDATNVDWEDICIDDKGRVIVADIGDNLKKRRVFTLYRFSEPSATNEDEKVTEPQVLNYRYPRGQGPYDAEALFAFGGDAYLFTKDPTRTRLYKLPLPPVVRHGETLEAEFIAESNTFATVTGAAISHDGKHIALINYLTILVLDLPGPLDKLPGGPATLFDAPRRVRLALLGQTEAVTFDRTDLMIATEGGSLYRMKDVFSDK